LKEVVNFQLDISDVSKINPLISRYKAYLAYPDEPANGYVFSKDVLMNLSYSLLGCPVVAGFMNGKDGSLLGGHSGDLAIDQNNKVKRTPDPIPIGFSAYDQQCWFEEYKDREYLTTFIYVWDARYPELENLSERTIYQSLELAIDEQQEGQYKIVQDAVALGICLLENVSPAFEFSHIEKFSLIDLGSKLDSLTSELNQLKQEYEDIIKFSNTQTNTQEQNLIKEEGEDLIKEAVEKFSLNSNQIREILNNFLSQFKYQNGDYEWNKYWVNCYDETYVYVDDEETYKTYRMTYDITDNVATVDIESAEEVIRGGYIPVGKPEQETATLSEDEEGKEEEEQDNKEQVNESSNANVDPLAMQELNEKSAEENEQLANENLEVTDESENIIAGLKTQLSEMEEKMSQMQADMSVCMTENEQLKEFKKNIENQNKEFAVETTLKEVQESLPPDEIEACRASAEQFSLENIDVWKNEVKAKAFNFSKGISEKKPFIQVAFPTSDKPKSGTGLWD